ncbi:MAG: hypothetical protein ACE5GE_11845 [Phycisphaerae bacterium]
MNSVASDPSSTPQQAKRCPACGQPLTDLVRGRCPLCEYQVTAESITAPDTTPFGQAEEPRRRQWWAQTVYVWSAGAGRLSHLSLMRTSKNSARYFRRTLALLVMTATLCGLALTGWHAVRPLPVEAGGQAPQPSGIGWMRVTLNPIPSGQPTQVVACWWNLPQAVIGAAVAMLESVVLAYLLLAVLRRGTESALLKAYRGQQRLSAAFHYAVGWAVPLIPAGVILALLPLTRVAQVGRWAIVPPAAVIYVPAVVLAGFGVIMGWFGLVRLASTVPVRTRRRVVVFCGLVMPLVGALLAAGAVWGLLWVQSALAERMQLQW